jgi:ABC-2 type transport system permease protein
VFGTGEARILERGYRRYDGPRLGRGASVRSVASHAIQRVLGIKRAAWAKVLPVVAIAIAYIPAIVFVGIVALTPDDPNVQQHIPTYGQYYAYIISAIAFFVAVVAPEVLCPDRRTGMLGIYLASPLSRDTYLLGKAMAVAAVLAIVSIGPPFIMMIAFSVQGHGPVGVGDFAVTAVRILGAGAAITLFYTALSLGISSLTDRKSFASAGIILALLVTAAVSGALQANGSPAYELLNLFHLPIDLAGAIHGGPSTGARLSVLEAAGASLAWTLLFAIVVRVRYARLQVTR